MSTAQLTDVVLGLIRENCPPGTPEIDDFDRPLADYGIDSLDLSSVLLAIEEGYGIKIPDEDLGGLLTVNGMLAYLREKCVADQAAT